MPSIGFSHCTLSTSALVAPKWSCAGTVEEYEGEARPAPWGRVASRPNTGTMTITRPGPHRVDRSPKQGDLALIPAVAASEESRRALEPIDRISEVFCGRIMVLIPAHQRHPVEGWLPFTGPKTFREPSRSAEQNRPRLLQESRARASFADSHGAAAQLRLLIARQPVTASTSRPDSSGTPRSGTPKARRSGHCGLRAEWCFACP